MHAILPNCIERPTGRVTPKTFVPPQSEKLPVGRGDSFYSIARRRNLDPWWLVYYNFPSVGETMTLRGARQTNWYLANYLGCVDVTKDRKNYIFSERQARRFIYVPVRKAPEPPKPLPSNVWFGFGIKQTNGPPIFAVQQNETANAVLCSWDKLTDCFGLATTGNRYGVTVSLLGQGATVSAFIATGVAHPRQLSGHSVQGIDYAVGLGPLVGNLKTAAKAWRFRKAAKLVVGIAEREKTRELFHQLINNARIDINDPRPKLHVLDLYSPNIEASVYYQSSTVRIDWVHRDAPAVSVK